MATVLFFIFSLIWYLPLYFRKGKTDKLVLALLVPFMMHGMNDFFAFSLTDIMKLKQLDDLSAVTILGALVWIVVFLVFIIYILIRLNRAVKESRQ